MLSQKNKWGPLFAASLLLLCLSASAQPDDPNNGRRPEPRVPLTGIGWLLAAGAVAGGLATLRFTRQPRLSKRHPRAKSFQCLPIVLGFTLQVASAQDRITISDGDWEAPSTWSDGIVPTPGNSSAVRIRHTVTVADDSDVSVDNLVVEGGRLVVSEGGVLQIVNGDSTDMQVTGDGTFDVWGTVIAHDGISLDGTSAANTTFREGSIYQHRASGEGSIPVAQWHPQSTFEMTGISGNISMHSEAWGQDWGTIIYHCPSQGEFVEFRGLLKTIQGDLIISSTNNSVLRLSQGQTTDLTVGGDLIVSGPSEVWFSQSGSCAVDVGGEFLFASTSGASSYFTTTGTATVTIGGNLVVDAEHRLRMASGSSTGKTELTVRGDVTILRGRIDAAGTGSGTVTFGGSTEQRVQIARAADTGFDGNVSFRISAGADVDLGTSLLANTTGGDLVVDGSLRLGSLNETGAIQSGQNGNIQVAGNIVFGPSSRVIYNGSGTQYLSYGSLETKVEILSPRAVVLTDIQFNELNTGSSEFAAGAYTLSVARNVYGDNLLLDAATLVMNGSGQQVISATGASLHTLFVMQTAPGSVVLEQPLSLSGTLSIESAGTQLLANGNLTLLSTSESPDGTASVARLAEGAGVVGNVIVQRFIAGSPGDKYRYISSSVASASVAQLMDDIPVTGTFEDADMGGELPEDAPSLFYYSEEMSDWIPFPTTGTSDENQFVSGRGYCLFNWNGEADSNWDVTGTVHQGSLLLPVTYTESEDTVMHGWNLVGNPYPSTIRWGPSGWDSQHVSASIAVRDNLAGGFRYWDGEVGSLSDGLLASGQSFWVRTTGENPYLVITEEAKASEGTEYYRNRSPDFLELRLSTAGLTDRAYLHLREDALEELDEYDAPKLPNDSLSLSFRTADGVLAAIDARPRVDSAERIPLGITGATGQNLAFRIRGYGALQAASFALVDDDTGVRYNFDVRGALTIGAADKLSLVVESYSGTEPLILEANSEQGRGRLIAYPIPARENLFLGGPELAHNEVVQIYSTRGLLLKTVRAIRRNDGFLLVDLSGLPAGYYIVVLPGKNIPSVIRIFKAE